MFQLLQIDNQLSESFVKEENTCDLFIIFNSYAFFFALALERILDKHIFASAYKTIP